MSAFAQRHPITDVCLLVTNLEASIRFYAEKLGFALAHRAPGFADFTGAGLTLALWERVHLSAHTGAQADPQSQAAVLVAVRLDSPGEVDAVHAELTGAGIEFVGPPADYPWNARCAYFHGPDGEVWELYAWHDGGAPGAAKP